jgi:hypothetical protein
MALRFLNSGYFAGKVGIGTETSYTVGGTAQVTIATGSAETALAFGPSNNDMLYMRSAGSQGNFQFQTSVNSGNSGSIQLQPFGGNVGIGTTNPNAKLDIQGTQGQLFSVTDDLSGEIFAVSDISGVPIMTVNSSGVSYFDGNVGIGTTSPGAKLDVIGGSLKVSDTYATVKIIGTGGLSRVFLGDTADEDVGYLEYNHISNYFRIGVNAAERMRIDSSGNVGIGVTNPNGKLEVNGIVKIGNVTTGLSMNGSSATEFLISGADTGGNAWNSIHIKADGNDGLFIEKDTNNVGIGTTSPDSLLHVSADVSTAAVTKTGTITIEGRPYGILGDDIATIDFHNNGNKRSDIRMERGNTADDSQLVFSTSDTGTLTDRLIINEVGNVGIGTVSPAAGLQVALGGSIIPAAGTSTASAVFGNSTSDDNYGLAVGANSSGVGYISSQRTDGTATTYNLAIQPNGGNVSIGGGAIGNPGNDKLQVDGTLRVGPYFAVSDRDFIKLVPHGSDTRIISPNERFHIENPDGNIIITPSSAGGLGINTTSPDFKLDVDGTFGVSDLPFNTDSVSVLVADETIGAELITNGNFATDSDWTKSSNVSISGGQATFTANSAAQYIIQGSLWPANSLSGQKVKLTYTIVSNSLNAGDFRIGGYTGASAFTLNGLVTTVGTHNIILDVRTTAGDDNAIDLYITSAATSGALVIDNVSVKQVTSASNQIQKRELGTGAFGPTPVGAFLPLTAGSGDPLTGDLFFNGSGKISPNTADGSDNAQIEILGGGASGDNRGASVHVAGNEHGNGGLLQLRAGSGSVSQIRSYTNGSEKMRIDSSGNVMIGNTGASAKLDVRADTGYVFRTENASGNTFRIEASSGNIYTTGDLYIEDSDKIRLGASSDLQIYHDGSNNISFIKNSNAGGLRLQSDELIIFAANGTTARADFDIAVKLFYNDSKKFETTNTGVAVTGDINIDSALLSNQENTDIDSAATEVVAQVAHATYTAAFFDFVVKKGTNVRSGTVYACHNGDTTPLVEFTETSTNDLGDTSDVTLSVDISGTNMRLLATVTSDDWSVKSLIRAI